MRGGRCLELDAVPDLLGLARAFPQSFPFLLENSARGPAGGHSLLLYADGDVLQIMPGGAIEGPGTGQTFFDRLESWYQAERTDTNQVDAVDLDPVPFRGGWFLYLGYEIAAEIEDRLRLPVNATGLPDAIAARCRGALVIVHPPEGKDQEHPSAWLVAENSAVQEAMMQLLAGKANEPIRQPGLQPTGDSLAQASLNEEDPEKFLSGVRRVLDYLRDGDVFQVNISRSWTGQWAGQWTGASEQNASPVSIYERLREFNPAPFAGLMRWGDKYLLSSSPERLAQLRGKEIQTRPIAGTRPRSSDPVEDLALARELLENVKERAEHIMLIDLERNDLGRVCRPGSIEVNELMVIESHAHVHHIVSNVRGILLPEASPIDAIKAIFPGGTITGCPKIRCMEIIAELEKEGRGFYTGSMGYLGLDGTMDLNILIRSMLVCGQDIVFRTGAGIVSDSDPERELQETRDKARGLLLALGCAPQEMNGA